MVHHVFHAEIWEHAPGDPGSWHFLTLPANVSEEIAVEAGPREGFGSVRVEGGADRVTGSLIGK